MSLPADDRTDFEALVELVSAHIDVCLTDAAGGAAAPGAGAAAPRRELHVMGESMGGLLALAGAHARRTRACCVRRADAPRAPHVCAHAVAQRRPDAVKQLVLVNPASSFDRTPWATVAPLLPSLPGDAYNIVPFALAPFLGNPLRLAAAAVGAAAAAAGGAGAPPPAPLDAAAGAAVAALAQLSRLGALSQIIPPPALAHRVALLAAGCAAVNARLADVAAPTLLVVGEQDLLLPSEEEGRRLAQRLPAARLHVVRGGSHALLQEGLDLPQLLRDTGVRPHAAASTQLPAAPPQPQPRAGARARIALGAAAMPSAAALARARQPLATLRRVVSPVFYSTASDGTVVEGLAGLPCDERPLLFVGNHQLFAPDLGLLIEEVLLRRGTLLRGLAHPAVFAAGGNPGLGATAFGTPPGASRGRPGAPAENMFQTFGAVPVSGKNLYALLSAGEAALLFPGGVREAYKRRGEAYKLLWPARPEFVRHALRTGATIVPFAAVGAEDAVEIVADAEQLLAAPLLGDALRARAAAVPAARAVDTRATEQGGKEELFLPPLIVPSASGPARYYFRFGAPRRTAGGAAGGADDPEAAAALYAAVRSDVEDGIAYLLRKRQEDPFRDLAPRLLFEAAAGRPAPSFRP